MINKKTQEEKLKIFMPILPRKAQEEIAGFAIILVLIAIVLVVFLSISSNKNKSQSLEDYESSSFLKALLEQTTSCEVNNQFMSVKELIFQCDAKANCIDGNNSCTLLSKTLKTSLDASWDVSNQSSIKGYNFIINSDTKNIANLTKGIITSNYKGAIQNYSISGRSAEIYIRVYT